MELTVEMPVIIRGTDPPGRTFGSYADVAVAVQVGRDPVDPVAGDAATPEWRLSVRRTDGDFRGPAVHGKRGDRFLYLTWVDRSGGGFETFRRAKLMLDRVDPALVEQAAQGRALVATVRLTDDRGGPRCARVDPPAVVWSVE
jgi:hypothetical protein